MKRKMLLLRTASAVLALGLTLSWRLWSQRESVDSKEPKRISILLRGTRREAEALQRVLKNYVSRHPPMEYEIFHQAAASHHMPEFPFSLVLADAETLANLRPKLKRFEPSAFQDDLIVAPLLIQDGKSIGLPLYEHRYMTLYYDRRKISAKFGTWSDLASVLMPLTHRLEHKYGLALGEDAEHVLPFFPQLWQDADRQDLQSDQSAYAQLTLLRHTLPIAPLDCSGSCADALFKAGQAAMALAADEQLDAFAEALGSDRLGIMPLPFGKAPRQTQYLGLAADLKAGDRQAAEDFVSYISSPAGQKEIFREFRSIPSLTLQGEDKLDDRLGDELLDYLRRNSIPVIESDYEAALVRLEPSLKPFLKGKIGETEAAIALTRPVRDQDAHE